MSSVMKDDSDYAEAGADYYDLRDQRNHEYLVRHRHHQARTCGGSLGSAGAKVLPEVRWQRRRPDSNWQHRGFEPPALVH
jgi:hypothetical protein